MGQDGRKSCGSQYSDIINKYCKYTPKIDVDTMISELTRKVQIFM